MKIKISITDDSGKEYEGMYDIRPKGSLSADKMKEQIQTEKNINYDGLTGGIMFLISKRFFEKPQTSNNVTEEMKKEGYYYSFNSVDKILRVNFVNKKKILTRVKENNVWHYVLRK